MKKTNMIKLVLLLTTFTILFSNILAIGNANTVGIKNGLEVKWAHWLTTYPYDVPTTATFTNLSGGMFHVDWYWAGAFDETGSWDVNVSTRRVSNVVNFGLPEGNHSLFWIYTDISLDDQIIIGNIYKSYAMGDADTTFNVTGEAMHGEMELWQLEDAHGSVLWYEKTKGFLVNGTTRYSGNMEIFTFESTNAFAQDPPAIPGYSFLLIGVFIGFGVVLIRMKTNQKKSKNKQE